MSQIINEKKNCSKRIKNEISNHILLIGENKKISKIRHNSRNN